MSIISLTDAKAALNIPPDDTTNDVELQAYVDAITGAIEAYKQEVIEPRSITEVRSGLSGARRIRLDSGPVISITSVATLDGQSSWDVSNFYPVPDSRTVLLTNGPSLTGDLILVYQAGYAVVPPKYKQGALVVLQHVWSTQRGSLRGAVRGAGSSDTTSTYSIPNKAIEWLGKPNPVGL